MAIETNQELSLDPIQTDVTSSAPPEAVLPIETQEPPVEEEQVAVAGAIGRLGKAL